MQKGEPENKNMFEVISEIVESIEDQVEQDHVSNLPALVALKDSNNRITFQPVSDYVDDIENLTDAVRSLVNSNSAEQVFLLFEGLVEPNDDGRFTFYFMTDDFDMEEDDLQQKLYYALIVDSKDQFDEGALSVYPIYKDKDGYILQMDEPFHSEDFKSHILERAFDIPTLH